MNMSVILDLITALILIFCVIICSKKGFFGSSQKIISIALSLLLMLVFSKSINTYLTNSKVYETINGKIYEVLSNRSKGTDEDDEVTEKETFLSKLGIPKIYENEIEKNKESIEIAKDNLIRQTSDNITVSVINILSVVILYFLIRILLAILFKVVNVIFKLPGLKTVNKLLGAVCGVIQGLFIIYVLCAVIMCFIPEIGNIDFKEMIENSLVTKYFYNNNYLLKIFM